MIKKKNFCFLFVLVFLLFFLNWNYIQADSTVISEKLKNINEDVQAAVGKDGNVLAVWANKKANKAKYGQIYLAELNLQSNGTWEAGDQQLVSKKGQRPSVTYLPTPDQYAIVWDTGLAELADYEKNQKATKIQGRRYIPSHGDKSDAASSFTKIVTIINNGTIVIGPEIIYLHSDDGFDLCYLSCSEAEFSSNETIYLENNDFQYSYTGYKYNPLENMKGQVVSVKGAYWEINTIVWNDFIWVSWIEFVCGTFQETASGLFRLCMHSFSYNVLPIGSTPRIFYGGVARPMPLNGIMGYGTNCMDNERTVTIGPLDSRMRIGPTYPVSNQPINAFDIGFKPKISYYPQDKAKKSDTYVVYAQTKGPVEYFNVSTEGKPGKAQNIFKTKKDRFGDMDVLYIPHEDEVLDLQDGDKFLMFYSEFTKKNKKKATINCTTFEVK